MKKTKKKSPITRTDTDDTRTDTEKIPLKSVSSPQKSVISWQAPEFQYSPKDISWYWLSLIIGIILLALSLWQRNFLFAVFIVIAWLVVVYSAGRNPTIWNFKLSEKGIEINLPNNDPASAKFYPYGEVEGFDIHPHTTTSDDINILRQSRLRSFGVGVHGELILKLKKRFSSYLKINFPAEEEEKIKDFLQKYITKEEYSESLADSFSKLIRF
jgi:hypothetical protein